MLRFLRVLFPVRRRVREELDRLAYYEAVNSYYINSLRRQVARLNIAVGTLEDNVYPEVTITMPTAEDLKAEVLKTIAVPASDNYEVILSCLRPDTSENILDPMYIRATSEDEAVATAIEEAEVEHGRRLWTVESCVVVDGTVHID